MVETATSASRENRLLKWRAALGAFMQGGPRPRVLFIGDSKMMGAGAGTAGTGFTDGAASKRKSVVLGKLMSASGFAAADTAFFASNRAPTPLTYDTRITAGAGWSFSTNVVATFGGQATLQNAGGGAGVAAFSPVGTFDTIDIIYAQGSVVGTFTVSDGATLLDTVNGNDPTGKPVRKTIALASRGSGKTINISRVSGNVYIIAVIPYDSQAPSIELLNAGAYGSKSTDWTASSNFNAGAVDAWVPMAPHLTFIALGANDKNQGVPVATFKQNIQTLITRAQVTGDVVLVNEAYGNGAFNNNSAEFRQALIELANANGCAFHDEAARVNYQSNPTWFADSIHETAFAHADQARMYLPHVLPHLKF